MLIYVSSSTHLPREDRKRKTTVEELVRQVERKERNKR
jgi:hypothetical protein